MIYVLTQHLESDTSKLADGYFQSIEEVITFSPDICVIANPAPNHVDVGLIMAKIGAHTLIEKPLSDRLENTKSLIDAYKLSHTQLLVLWL